MTDEDVIGGAAVHGSYEAVHSRRKCRRWVVAILLPLVVASIIACSLIRQGRNSEGVIEARAVEGMAGVMNSMTEQKNKQKRSERAADSVHEAPWRETTKPAVAASSTAVVVAPSSTEIAAAYCRSCTWVPCGQCQQGCYPSPCSTNGAYSRNGCANNNFGRVPTSCIAASETVKGWGHKGQPLNTPAKWHSWRKAQAVEEARKKKVLFASFAIKQNEERKVARQIREAKEAEALRNARKIAATAALATGAVTAATPGAIPVLGCMIVNREDLLYDMLRSIDYPVQQLVLVHNPDSNANTNIGIDKLFARLSQNPAAVLNHNYVQSVLTFHHDSNLGFSAGVNRIVLGAPNTAYWLVTSNDVAFRGGALQEIATQMAANTTVHHSSCVWGVAGNADSKYASFVLTQRAVQTAGYFDENFWPAYGEDCDYTVRLARSGCPLLMSSSTRLASHIGSASWTSTQYSSTLARQVQRIGTNKQTFNNFDYLHRKWGADVCGARLSVAPYLRSGVGFVTPFNKPDMQLSQWTLERKRRKMLGGIDKCVACTPSPNSTIAIVLEDKKKE